MSIMRCIFVVLGLAGTAAVGSPLQLASAEAPVAPAEGRLYVGAAQVDITPDRPVALLGQMHRRIATEVESPVTATALALETRIEDKPVDHAILVSLDLVALSADLYDGVRAHLAERLPHLDPRKLILSATHSHTAPDFRRTRGYEDVPEDFMQPAEYLEFLIDRVAQVAEEAWEGRAPGSAGWGLGHAVIAHNRRAVYADGRAVMYGDTRRGDFRHIEGYSDHNIDVLFFWDNAGTLIATGVNVACPAQEVEMRNAINADFWHETREALRRRYGESLYVLGWTGASGDQVSRPMYYRRANKRMRELRGITRLEEVARRLVRAWEEAYEGARKERHDRLVLAHEIRPVELPLRQVTDEEYARARDILERTGDDDPALTRWMARRTVRQYERMQDGGTYGFDLHVIRLGDVAIATNDFEYFTDYGTRIKARSRALQTFILQLSGPGGSYLPTERAARGGGYGAEGTRVGPEGGQRLVEETIEAIDRLWDSDR